MDFKNAQTQEAKPVQYNIEAPTVAVVKIINFIYSESSKKGTPCIELNLAQQGVEDFKSYDKTFPATSYLKKDEFQKTFTVNGPLCTIQNWVGQSKEGEYYAWKMDNPQSFAQTLLKMAIAAGVEAEFRATTFDETNPKEIATTLQRLFGGKLVSCVFKKKVRIELDGDRKPVSRREEPALYMYGPVFMAADKLNDLKEVARTFDPSTLVEEETYTRVEAPAQNNTAATSNPSGNSFSW